MASKSKKEGNGYVYSIPGGADPLPPESVKRVIPKGWGSLMRSKTYRERTVQEVKKSDEIHKEVVVSSRKSVSSITEAKGRLSVSSIKEVRSSRSSVSKAEDVGPEAALLDVRVLVTDMPGFMQLHAFRCARTSYDSLEKFSAKQMCFNIKKEFDKVYGPTWHCIVGSSFGSFVTHATGGFLYFSMEKLYILVFKTKVKNAQYSS